MSNLLFTLPIMQIINAKCSFNIAIIKSKQKSKHDLITKLTKQVQWC